MGATVALYQDRVDYPDGRHESWWVRWAEQLSAGGHQVRFVDIFASNVIEQIRGCDGLIWRHTHGPSLRWVSRRLLPAVELQLGIPVYPDQRTTWHYDDKIAQHYLLGAAGIPMPRTWIFWRLPEALAFLRSANYPLVLKLTSGASAQNVRLLSDRAEAEAWAQRLFGEGVTNLKDPPRPSWRRALHSWREAADFALTGRRPHPGGWWEVHKDYMYVQEFLPGNAYDTRIAIFSDRCFGYRRYNRPDDWRASGSGRRVPDPAGIDERFIRLGMRLVRALGLQSCCMDGLYRDGEPVIGEISYSCMYWSIPACPGYWHIDGDPQTGALQWVAGSFMAQDLILERFLQRVEAHRRRDPGR